MLPILLDRRCSKFEQLWKKVWMPIKQYMLRKSFVKLFAIWVDCLCSTACSSLYPSCSWKQRSDFAHVSPSCEGQIQVVFVAFSTILYSRWYFTCEYMLFSLPVLTIARIITFFLPSETREGLGKLTYRTGYPGRRWRWEGAGSRGRDRGWERRRGGKGVGWLQT